ncbi:Uma2 family endonuclease [Desulfotomaculum nigrificans]|uniref:Uma2 family endonuclease n=1 Tax=Desulfotomaculum nigrificans TaxID=1565 RepID=UPI0001FAE737|nr:Uma2 family endonuclease [Desulfotomaculum nigrificans]
MATELTIFNDREYTIEDYMKIDDGQRYELIGGELIMVPSPKPRHQRVSAKISFQFESFLRQNPLGEVYYAPIDVLLGDQVVQPDIIFISDNRLNIVGELNIQGAPDLVIEVLSPSTASYDKKKKGQIYLKYGVKEYWTVDIDAKIIDVYKVGEKQWQWLGSYDEEDTITTQLIPGLEIKLNEIF